MTHFSQICTLEPPCNHLTVFDLAAMGTARRKELPKRHGGIVCSRFKETGCCDVFNRVGRCSCDHPLNIHTIVSPVLRCPVCSLPAPCKKCEYYIRYQNLVKYLKEKKTELTTIYLANSIFEVEHLCDIKCSRKGIKDDQMDKFEDRSAKCRTLLEKVQTQLEQIEGWTKNNSGCTDNTILDNKQKWISKNIDAAFYATDRTLKEWRDKDWKPGQFKPPAEVEAMNQSSVISNSNKSPSKLNTRGRSKAFINTQPLDSFKWAKSTLIFRFKIRVLILMRIVSWTSFPKME